ncbi:Rossmann-like and DUF2520 domain-containing protein [Costertonia aggregata]|uniref:DUF2520 domain-containing protein n=1 Tax=Costertonia aggregata TaxID=343403 RepID=A0A7H9ATG2_9FLAO|nr:DUF2520 domain-containing protein [Costertonia aggregata]QLG46758.1 DUF2520 domain-containing protein [Costertonia aggregata]
MITITLVGTGNVAKHLFDAFLALNNVTVIQVVGRNKKALTHFEKHAPTTTDFKKINPSDVLIIAISDDSINTVSQLFTNYRGLVCHTSGSVPLNDLKSNRKGVFYPLQTFTVGKKIDFKTVPICIEAKNKEDEKLLERLAKTLSKKVYHITSEQRKPLHLAAVFVNNFTNHLYHIGENICTEHKIPFDLLKALIMETAHKIQTLSPKESQTGPAKRNDTRTIEEHLNQIQDKDQYEIYGLLTQSIQKIYGKKL